MSPLNGETQSNATPGHKILVLGDDTRSFLTIVRSLGRHGFSVHVAPIDLRSPALRSRYISRIHRLPPYKGDGAEWIDAVRRLLTAERFDLVIPCDDRFVLPFDAHSECFRGLATIAIPPTAAIATLFNKERTRALATSVGVNLARTTTIEECRTPHEAFRRLGTPVVVKPKNSFGLTALHSRARVRIVDTPEALAEVIADLDPGEFYFESFFAGSGVGLSVLADAGKIVLAFQHHRVHQAPEGGVSPYRVSAAIAPELMDACGKMLGALAFTGLAMFEFRRNFETGDWILLEVNARPWGSMPLPVALGVDFPYAWFRLLVDKTPPQPQSYPAGIYGRNLVLDVACLRAILSQTGGYGAKLRVFGRWLRSFSAVFVGREHSDTIVADDPRPGLVELGQSLGWVTSRLVPRAPFTLVARRWAARQALRAAFRSAAREDRPISIVFVCQGNICRSPFAARLLRKLVGPDNGMVTVASAGTMPVEGRACPDEAIAAARRFGIDLATHRSHYTSDRLIETASVLLVFDERNAADLRSRFPDLACPILYLGVVADGGGGPWEIRDPYGGDDAQFQQTYGVIERDVHAIAARVASAVGQTSGANAGLVTTIEPARNVAHLAALWRSLEARADCSFFLTWDWIGRWLVESQSAPLLLSVRRGETVVGLALFQPARLRRHFLVQADALMLHHTGVLDYDIISIEHNGFLVDRAFADAARDAIITFLKQERLPPGDFSRWDELHFDGVNSDFERSMERSGLQVWHYARKSSWVVDLDAVRASGKSYLDTLSANTRYQIRRSLRIYEKRGPLVAKRAESQQEAMEFIAGLKSLHQHYWQSRGEPGGFGYPFFERFHRALVADCLERGTIGFVRVSAGDFVIGYVSNFVHRGHVYQYLTGFSYEDDAKIKPGLVSHYLCIERHLREGARVYDFMAGDYRYKNSLGTPGTEIFHLVLQRATPMLVTERALRRLKSALLAPRQVGAVADQ